MTSREATEAVTLGSMEYSRGRGDIVPGPKLAKDAGTT